MPKFNPWTEVEAEDVALYTLPPQTIAKCEVRTEKHIFVGTNVGIYYTPQPIHHSHNQGNAQEAKLIGLEEHEIVKIEARGQTIIAWTAEGKIFTALDYALSGRR